MAQELFCQIESAIIENQPEALHTLLKRVGVNINILSDSALILAVKLSRGSIVKILLRYPGCSPNHQNMHSYCPLDIAVVMAFDNQKEPRQSACWNILEILLEAGAEPASSSGMSYAVRSAFKRNDDQFMLRLIDTLTLFSTSLDLHSLLLREIHELQYLYTGIHLDEFLERSANYTIKLMKLYGKEALENILCCFSCYSESHWDSQDRRYVIMTSLLLYATACGWKLRNSAEFTWISLFNLQLAQWCRQMTKTVHSLIHLSRLSIVSFPTARKHFQEQTMPRVIRNYVDFCDIDTFMSSSSPNIALECLQL